MDQLWYTSLFSITIGTVDMYDTHTIESVRYSTKRLPSLLDVKTLSSSLLVGKISRPQLMHICNGGGSYTNRFHVALRITGMVPPIAPVTREPLRRVARKHEYRRDAACGPTQAGGITEETPSKVLTWGDGF